MAWTSRPTASRSQPTETWRIATALSCRLHYGRRHCPADGGQRELTVWRQVRVREGELVQVALEVPAAVLLAGHRGRSARPCPTRTCSVPAALCAEEGSRVPEMAWERHEHRRPSRLRGPAPLTGLRRILQPGCECRTGSRNACPRHGSGAARGDSRSRRATRDRGRWRANRRGRHHDCADVRNGLPTGAPALKR